MYMGQFCTTDIDIKDIKHTSRFNRYMVKAIGLLISTLHTTPFLYVKVYFGVMHKYIVDVTRSDTPWGSKPPQLQVGTFNFGV